MKRIVSGRLGAALVMAAMAVTACGGGGSTTASDTTTSAAAAGASSAAPAAERFTVGVSMLNMRDPDLAVMAQAMRDAADQAGVDLVQVDAKGDVATELTQVEDLITRKVNAVVMMPIDGTQSQPAAKKVNDANIPLFILSTAFAEGSTVKIESYIGVDDTEAGRMQADYLNAQLPDGGKMIYIVGTYGASWTDRRKTGFMEKVNKNFEIVSEVQANGSRDEAKRVMEDLLGRYPSGSGVTALVTHNDEMAIGASSAISEAGRLGEFKVIVGVDGTPPAITAIEDKQMTATIKQDSAAQGVKAIEVSKAFLGGDPVDPAYNLPFTLVTAENVGEFK